MTHENEEHWQIPSTLEEAMEQQKERMEQVRRNSTTTLEKIASFFGLKTYGSNWNQAVADSELFDLSDKVDENNREDFFSKVDAHADHVAFLFVSIVRDCPRKKKVFITMRGMFAFEIFRVSLLKNFSSDFERHALMSRVMTILHGSDQTISHFSDHNINRLVEEEREKKGIPQDSYVGYKSYEERERRFEEFLECTVLMARNEGFSKKCVSDLQFFVEIPREERNKITSSCDSLWDEVNAKFEFLDFKKRITERFIKSREAVSRMGKILTKYPKEEI